MNKLKEKWRITSNLQLIIILIVFSITGLTSVWIARPLLEYLNVDRTTWMFWPIRILIIFPIYQVLIIVIGTLFGQFKFFWQFEKKMLSRLGFKQFKD